MSINYLKYSTYFIAYFVFVNVALTQATFELGTLPAVNLNKKLKKDWSLNFKIEARQLIMEGDFQSDANKGFTYVRTDNSLLAAKKVGLNSKIAGGYMLRILEDEIVHRIIQQYSIVQRMIGFRLAHRFSSDQTFSPEEIVQIRLRYRITSEIPLNGQSLDTREFYLKINNEYLPIFQGKERDFEIRIVPLLGYQFARGHKTEFGMDYRVKSMFSDEPSHSFWTSLSWYVDI